MNYHVERLARNNALKLIVAAAVGSSELRARSGATVENGDVRFSTLECATKGPYSIAYEFTTRFHLLSARAGDTFRGLHDEFYRNDKPPHVLTAEEEREYQKVRCLVGCETEFVTSQNGQQPD